MTVVLRVPELTVVAANATSVVSSETTRLVVASVGQPGPSGTPGLTTVSIPFSFDTPDILDGIDTGIVVPEGSFIVAGTVANLTTFDGDSPRIRVAPTQADAIADGAGGQILQAPVGFADTDLGGNLVLGTPLFNVGTYTVDDCRLWLGLGKSGGGDPGCATGDGVACISYVTP